MSSQADTIFWLEQKCFMKKIFFTALVSFLSLWASTQESDADLDVNITTTNEAWYASPWVWVVGAALFILLLVALTRGKRN